MVLVYIDMSSVTEPGCSQGSPLENWDVNYILNHLSSHLFSSPGTNTAISQPMPEVLVMERESSSLYWNRSVQFYTVIEAFMNIKVGLVYFIHCVGQSLTPRVWVTMVCWLCGYIKYQVSRIKHKNQWMHAQSDIQHLYLHTWALTGAGPDLITWITGRGESIREDIWR